MTRRHTKKSNFKQHDSSSLVDGLKKVHIGNDEWLIGKQTHVKEKGLHCVIYGPDRKEHHLWNNEVDKIVDHDHYGEDGYVNRHGNISSEAKAKIYILTSILDDGRKWCFDLEKVPLPGKLKIIYDNGTVKNVDFVSTFDVQTTVSTEKIINPVAYRIR